MINFLLGFCIAALYCPAMPRSGHELRWGLLALALSALIYYQNRTADRLTWPMAWGLALLAYAAASLAWAPSVPLGIGRLGELGVAFCAFYIGTTSFEYERLQLYRGLIWGLVPSAILIPLQLAGYTGVEQWAPPAGTYVNKLFVAELAVPLAIIALARGWWAYALAPSVIVLLTASRGAWFAVAVAAGMAWSRYNLWRQAAVWALFPLLAIGAAFLNPATANHRIDLWMYAVDHLSVLGGGIASFVGAVGAEHVHNDYLELAYELGLPGLALLTLCLATLPRHGAEYYAGIGLLTIACFSFPAHNPATAFLAAYLAGALAKFADPVLRSHVARGIGAGAGMARAARRYGLGHPGSRQG